MIRSFDSPRSAIASIFFCDDVFVITRKPPLLFLFTPPPAPAPSCPFFHSSHSCRPIVGTFSNHFLYCVSNPTAFAPATSSFLYCSDGSHPAPWSLTSIQHVALLNHRHVCMRHDWLASSASALPHHSSIFFTSLVVQFHFHLGCVVRILVPSQRAEIISRHLHRHPVHATISNTQRVVPAPPVLRCKVLTRTPVTLTLPPHSHRA